MVGIRVATDGRRWLPRVFSGDQPLAVRYEKQLREKGIPQWAPPEL